MITAEQLRILQHSLGLDEYGQGRQYRNHFVTGAGSTDYPHCMTLVEARLMGQRKGNELSGGSDIFHVTQQGIDYVATNSPKPPKVSKSKARYRRYLEYGDGFESFIEFCRWDSRPEHSWNGGAE